MVGLLVLIVVYFLSLFPAGSENKRLLTGTGTVLTEALRLLNPYIKPLISVVLSLLIFIGYTEIFSNLALPRESP